MNAIYKIRYLLLSAMNIFIVLLFLKSPLNASDITLSGAVYFKCNYNSTYMEKHGYALIKKNLLIKDFKIDSYAASYAEIVVRNQNDTIIGTGKTDEKGVFALSVPEEHLYRLMVTFRGREIQEFVPYTNAANITVDMGYFDTESVGSWIPVPPITYCPTCNIRFLESKEAR